MKESGSGEVEPWRAGEVVGRGGVARMREASKGGADGGRERCSTRGAARRLEKAAPEAAPWFLAHWKWDIRRQELWAAWQQEEGGARHWVGSRKGKKTDWYSRGGGVKLL